MSQRFMGLGSLTGWVFQKKVLPRLLNYRLRPLMLCYVVYNLYVVYGLVLIKMKYKGN